MAARNSGKEWTSGDISELKKLAKQNVDTDIIAEKLGRTTCCLYQSIGKKYYIEAKR